MRMETKAELRRRMAERKAAMTPEEIDEASRRLAGRFFATEEYRAARSLYGYLSFNQEVRTDPILRRAMADGKRVAAPKCVGREMRFHWLERLDDLAKGFYGIREPGEDAPLADDDTALVLVPGLAFCPGGRRVGYGGGYYDRWFATQPGHPAVALCFRFQWLERLPGGPHDMLVPKVIVDGID